MFGLSFVACGAGARAAPARARPAAGLGLRDDLRALLGGRRRLAAVVLVQKPDDLSTPRQRSSAARAWSGTAACSAARSAVVIWARRKGMLGIGLLDLCAAGAGARLRGRPRRLPDLRRRRLRQALGRAVGDGLSRRRRADGRSRSTRRRSTSRWRWDSSRSVLWHLRDRWRPGALFALYLVLPALERFLVEFLRRNEAIGLRAHARPVGLAGDDRPRRALAQPGAARARALTQRSATPCSSASCWIDR